MVQALLVKGTPSAARQPRHSSHSREDCPNVRNKTYPKKKQTQELDKTQMWTFRNADIQKDCFVQEFLVVHFTSMDLLGQTPMPMSQENRRVRENSSRRNFFRLGAEQAVSVKFTTRTCQNIKKAALP